MKNNIFCFFIHLLFSYLNCWTGHESVDGDQRLRDSSGRDATWQIAVVHISWAVSAVDAAHAGEFVHIKVISANSPVSRYARSQTSFFGHYN